MDPLTDALQKVKLDDRVPGAGQTEIQEVEENELEKTGPVGPFRFLDLPSEIRLRIYAFVLFTPRRGRAPRTNNGSVGASSKNPTRAPVSHRVALFLVSRRIHDEASDYYYSMQTFRLFPIQDYSRMPTVRDLPSRYRSSVATIELILGSSWTKPPRSWTINRGLGLEEMVRVRTLKIFIECDPSHPVFEGFRVSPNFYTDFAGGLLQQILTKLPNLVQVEFDGYPSVVRNGALMKRLLYEARSQSKKILWGPERGWSDWDEDEPKEPTYTNYSITRQGCGPVNGVSHKPFPLLNSK